MRGFLVAASIAVVALFQGASPAEAFPLRGPIGRAVLHGAACDAAGNTAVAAMTTAPDAKHKAAYCTIIKTLESTGVWSKLDTLFLTASHSQQSTRLNLVNPALSCSEAGTGALTYVTDAYIQTDGTKYLTCGTLVPASNPHYSQDSAVAGVFTDAAVNGYKMGSTSSILQIRVSSTTSMTYHLNGSLTLSMSTSAAPFGWRHLVANRASSASFDGMHNSTTGSSFVLSTQTDTSSSPGTQGLYLFRAGSTNAASGSKIYAAYTGSALSGDDFANIHLAIVAYLQTIGAI